VRRNLPRRRESVNPASRWAYEATQGRLVLSIHPGQGPVKDFALS
jgi:hypothetical protein